MLSADFRMTLNYSQIRGLMAAGILSEEADSPDDLREALLAVLAKLTTPTLTPPNHAPLAR